MGTDVDNICVTKKNVYSYIKAVFGSDTAVIVPWTNSIGLVVASVDTKYRVNTELNRRIGVPSPPAWDERATI
jgi:hypothetical protein